MLLKGIQKYVYQICRSMKSDDTEKQVHEEHPKTTAQLILVQL